MHGSTRSTSTLSLATSNSRLAQTLPAADREHDPNKQYRLNERHEFVEKKAGLST